MRHHQTRRKGRRSLKNKNRITHRRQRGGADITSADAWFKAVSNFETTKGESNFRDNYPFSLLTDQYEPLKVPDTVEDENLFTIEGVSVIYPPTQLPEEGYEPITENISLIEIAQTITYLFYGEQNIGEGLINKGINTLSAFIQYVNNVKNIPDNTDDPTGFENKKVVWYLNELETALQKASGRERGFTSIYDTPKLPFYILYLAANPVKLPNKPDLTPLPQDIQKEFGMFASV